MHLFVKENMTLEEIWKKPIKEKNKSPHRVCEQTLFALLQVDSNEQMELQLNFAHPQMSWNPSTDIVNAQAHIDCIVKKIRPILKTNWWELLSKNYPLCVVVVKCTKQCLKMISQAVDIKTIFEKEPIITKEFEINFHQDWIYADKTNPDLREWIINSIVLQINNVLKLFGGKITATDHKKWTITILCNRSWKNSLIKNWLIIDKK